MISVPEVLLGKKQEKNPKGGGNHLIEAHPKEGVTHHWSKENSLGVYPGTGKTGFLPDLKKTTLPSNEEGKNPLEEKHAAKRDVWVQHSVRQ